MATYDFDLFTIGAGSGGVRASRLSAGYGAKVAIAERRHFGGTCVNLGCIPKKLLVYAAQYGEDLVDAAAYGWSATEPRFDWRRLIENKDREIARLSRLYRRLLEEAGVTILEGSARLVDAHTVEVAGSRYSARYILVATGSRPVVPAIPGAEHAITSNEAFFLPALPPRVAIVGGGYIGVEFASIFHGLGARVTQIHRGPLFLRGFDDDVRRTLAEEMKKRGLDLRFERTVKRIDRGPGGLSVALSDGENLEVDRVMFATGRVPNTAGLGLERIGVELKANGAVAVDAYSRSTLPHLYAIGDCTDRLMLTPVAIAEAHAVAETLFHANPTPPRYENVPTAIFSIPSVGAVGLTEAEARRRYARVEIYRTTFRPLRHTLTGRPEQAMMKLVVDGATDRVLGCHMVGPEAGEIVQGLAIALNCGATKAQFDGTIGIHPTAAEEFVTMRNRVAA